METSAAVVPKSRTCRQCSRQGLEGPDFCPGQGNICRPCANAQKAAWELEVRLEGGERHDRRKSQMRIASAMRKFGITRSEATRLYSTDACQICQGVDPSGRRLNIDHCHATGRVRGVLCNRCNRGVGFFKDDPALLQRAVEYLKNDADCGIAGHTDDDLEETVGR